MRAIVMLATLILSVSMLTGCQSAGYKAINPAEYQQLRANYDITFGWNQKTGPDSLLLDGYAKNNRYFAVNDLTLTVSLLSQNGTEKATTKLLVHPSELRQYETAAFVIELPLKPQPGDILRNVYSYRAVENGEDGFFWVNNFEFPATP
ncbi:hypothetical protein KI809_06060 [Geobacter pelophilus]|uniref:Lipoprotein n=1 Tax=Geoanaerobacter pelophilus TaxID=60036 RepID=A0AAW4L7T3_9BACT|nr:hypothetical protein [Geoanaerobacter pelophilus]MBT0663862.1 hypothetical protein [Geoanaerobacter pelophilus]